VVARGRCRTSAGSPWARFDDLTAGISWRFPPPGRILIATEPDEVAFVLAEVEGATRAGDWAFGYLAYEAAGGLDATLVTADPALGGPPLAWFGLGGPPAPVPPVQRPPTASSQPPRWVPDWTARQHRAAVETVRAHIAAGQTYQCNLTDRLRATEVADPERLYAQLATAQRGAYNAYLDLGRHVIASASPELFFEWSGDLLRTRPMKGTAARGDTPVEDRAENLMIVDLLRNDLSRVARIGGVAVPALFALERYPTVWQLTSEVTARIRDGIGLTDVFRALFPCGSVTGAPKAATMRLIRDLENGPRGIYCGAIGYLAPPPARVRARFSVAIRTALIDRATHTAVYGAGGGITWDSRPAAERAELLAKARILSYRPITARAADATEI